MAAEVGANVGRLAVKMAGRCISALTCDFYFEKAAYSAI